MTRRESTVILYKKILKQSTEFERLNNGVRMPINHIPRVIFLSGILACILQGILWADNFERDPIRETQTLGTPVTPETLKNPIKPGAPAPSFRIVTDSQRFLVGPPTETSEKEKVEGVSPDLDPKEMPDEIDLEEKDVKEKMVSDSKSDSNLKSF